MIYGRGRRQGRINAKRRFGAGGTQGKHEPYEQLAINWDGYRVPLAGERRPQLKFSGVLTT